jgi:hypothetical protein
MTADTMNLSYHSNVPTAGKVTVKSKNQRRINSLVEQTTNSLPLINLDFNSSVEKNVHYFAVIDFKREN